MFRHMKYKAIREEELKNKVGGDWFSAFDTTEIVGNIDFCVLPKQDSLFGRMPLLWAEAKTGDYDVATMFVQLILTIGKARTFDKTLPPAFLGAFDFKKIAFVPYVSIQDIFSLHGTHRRPTAKTKRTGQQDRTESLRTWLFEKIEKEERQKNASGVRLRSTRYSKETGLYRGELEKENFMKIRWIMLMILFVCSATFYSQEFSDENYGDTRPSYIPLSRLTYLNGATLTHFQKFPVLQLSHQERKDLDLEIKKIPSFSSYYFSGCHDRSQATFQLLPAALRGKTYKVWVFSPERHTSTVSGTIGLKTEDPIAKQVAWGYHVALFFFDGNAKLVLDQGLSPGKLITIDQWFAKMNIPVGSFWTVTNGNNYLFNSTVNAMSPSQSNPANQDLFNGYFYNYVSSKDKYLSSNLARDDAGYMVMSQNVCPELKPLLTKPGELGQKLKSGQLPATCQKLSDYYNERFTYWRNLLEPLPITND
jgi:hypothetical protein